MTAVTPGRGELKRHEDEFYLLMRSLLTDVAIGKLGIMSSRANYLLHKLKHLESLRLTAKPADEGQAATIEECRSIFEGVKDVLNFAISLAWDAERLIPDSEPKRLRRILNNIRQGYLKPAVERLNALPPSTPGAPKP